MQEREFDDPLPDPPTVDEVAAGFPVPLATLAPQPAIRETGVNTVSHGPRGDPGYAHAAAICYAVLWNPDDLDDPMNHVVLPADVEQALANPPQQMAESLVTWMQWARFPMAYEAVQTQTLDMTDATLAERLAPQMRNVIGNVFREERHPGVFDPDGFIDPPAARDAIDASVIVDGVERPAITIPDAHALGLGVELDDAVVLVVFPRHLLPLVRLELTRRPRP